jgi:transcriptional regulator with XRE-family HTH domain
MARKPLPPRYSRHFVRQWRIKRDMTLEELAERIGRKHSTVQRIETRQIALTQPVLDDMAVALKTSRGKLLDEPPGMDD